MSTLGSARVPDGYFGDMLDVTLEYREGYIFLRAPLVNCRSPLPQASSESEAIWLLKNHPLSKLYFKNLTLAD